MTELDLYSMQEVNSVAKSHVYTTSYMLDYLMILLTLFLASCDIDVGLITVGTAYIKLRAFLDVIWSFTIL